MLGYYLGTHKATGKELRAQVAHIWTLAASKATKKIPSSILTLTNWQGCSGVVCNGFRQNLDSKVLGFTIPPEARYNVSILKSGPRFTDQLPRPSYPSSRICSQDAPLRL